MLYYASFKVPNWKFQSNWNGVTDIYEIDIISEKSKIEKEKYLWLTIFIFWHWFQKYFTSSLELLQKLSVHYWRCILLFRCTLNSCSLYNLSQILKERYLWLKWNIVPISFRSRTSFKNWEIQAQFHRILSTSHIRRSGKEVHIKTCSLWIK